MHNLYTVSSLAQSHPCAVFTICLLVVFFMTTSEQFFSLNWRDILRAGRARRSTLVWLNLLFLVEPLLPVFQWMIRMDPRRTRQLEQQLGLACDGLQSAERDLAQSRSKFSQLQAELDTCHSDLESSRDELAASRGMESQLHAQLKATQAALAEALGETQSYKSALERALDTSLDLELELNSVEKHETMLLEELQDRKADLAEAEDDYSRLQREMHNLRLDTRHAQLMSEAKIEELEHTVRELRRDSSKLPIVEKPRRKSRRSDSESSSKDLLVAPPTDAPMSFTFPRAEITVIVHPPEEPMAEPVVPPKQTYANALAVWPHYRTVDGRTLRGFSDLGRTVWVMWDRGCEWRQVREVCGELEYTEGGKVAAN
ncbi:hypothetical protein EXIGLDRAFT_841792 [Exidia glandulosa HHB12029]|uniref:Uncharacterized protein n=1 Tax=Exidia glandulosa HHB12029 TaxID=1314781 RepID=A0A165ZQL4_EXIGL|nr:hypothetical protein EXIGLDRAFT_841792 [Exidia glandulosa HHB12029]